LHNPAAAVTWRIAAVTLTIVLSGGYISVIFMYQLEAIGT